MLGVQRTDDLDLLMTFKGQLVNLIKVMGSEAIKN